MDDKKYGTCTKCGEICALSDPCCGAPVIYEGCFEQPTVRQVDGHCSGSHGNISHYVSDATTEKHAKCTDCGRITAFDDKLPFFTDLKEERTSIRGDKYHADYYCGCHGWD